MMCVCGSCTCSSGIGSARYQRRCKTSISIIELPLLTVELYKLDHSAYSSRCLELYYTNIGAMSTQSIQGSVVCDL